MSQDFDTLSKNAYSSGKQDIAALDALWGAVFGLSQWHFIARGASTNARPYIGYKNNEPMIFAFTDTDRLEANARQLKLLDEQGNVPILSIPTTNIISYIESFAQFNVKGIWFNPGGFGFFSPLNSLRGIKSHLDSLA